MFIKVILGNNIDTPMWIAELKEVGADNIIVVDYEYFGDSLTINGVLFLSTLEARKYIKSYNTVTFYKSLYALPGTNGNMSSLFKKPKN